MAERIVSAGGLRGIESGLLAELGIVRQVFTTRDGGVSPYPEAALNMGPRTPDTPENVQTNHRRALSAFGFPRGPVVMGEQVHGNRCFRAGKDWQRARRNGWIEKTDSLITTEPRLPLMAFYADCVPVFLVAPRGPCIGLVHAGWKGVLLGNTAATAEKLCRCAGIGPGDLYGYIGPHIGADHFRVGEDLAGRFSDRGYRDRVLREADSWRIDLGGCIGDDLEALGVPPEHLERSGYCTVRDRDLFFSHRREQGHTGRMAGILMLI